MRCASELNLIAIELGLKQKTESRSGPVSGGSIEANWLCYWGYTVFVCIALLLLPGKVFVFIATNKWI
jgi:hypothetical protein